MLLFAVRTLYRKNIFSWLPAYMRGVLRRRETPDRPVHVLFCFVDHFEPGWQRPDLAVERARVARWCHAYPALAARHQDADGQVPKHCFFYPEEEYREEHLRALSHLCAQGFGEMEIHLHHDQDTEEGLRAKLQGFIAKLVHVHDALPRERTTGDVRFAFIHGDWALDNSSRDGRWCGVNNELQVLRALGCYADFTLPRPRPIPRRRRSIASIMRPTIRRVPSPTIEVLMSRWGKPPRVIS